VETFWRHDVTWKSGCFLAPERGVFLKNSGVLQQAKMRPFCGVLRARPIRYDLLTESALIFVVTYLPGKILE
jgi:hypothetical protein